VAEHTILQILFQQWNLRNPLLNSEYIYFHELFTANCTKIWRTCIFLEKNLLIYSLLCLLVCIPLAYSSIQMFHLLKILASFSRILINKT